MSRILLDTSAYSAFKRGHQEIKRRLQEATSIELSPIVVGEFGAGFLKGTRVRENRAELEQFLASPRVVILAIDDETSKRYAIIADGLRSAGRPIPTNDIWIAASAMQTGAIVLTTDPHFHAIGQILAEVLEIG